MDEKKTGIRRLMAAAAVLLILCLGIALAFETLFILLGGVGGISLRQPQPGHQR